VSNSETSQALQKVGKVMADKLNLQKTRRVLFIYNAIYSIYLFIINNVHVVHNSLKKHMLKIIKSSGEKLET